MTERPVARRLAAILYADVVGYSRLMGEDEHLTLESLTASRALFAETIRRFSGRLVNAPGDSILVEFSSVADAVNCALEVQQAVAQRNEGLDEALRMRYRIGINLGDVLVADGGVYGDGVNIAARLESLAEPGGICVSGSVYDSLRRQPLAFQALGEQSFKNIRDPVRVYRALAAAEIGPAVPGSGGPVRRVWLPTALAAAVALGLAVSALLLRPEPEVPLAGKADRAPRPAATANEAGAAALPRQEKPSLAVLPFDNLSGDPKLDRVSDGITETLITDLSRLRNLEVIARNSVFTYKNRPVDVREVARDLDVRYVLEGSVQRFGDAARINTQLIDARTGRHLWAERYDRKLEHLFALQDEITRKTVLALNVNLLEGELARTRLARTDSLEAFELVRRADALWYDDRSGQSCAVYEPVGRLYARARALDPGFSTAVAAQAWHALRAVYFGCGRDRQQALAEGARLAQQALALDGKDPEAHTVLAVARLFQGRPNEFLGASDRALALGPNNVEVLANVAWGYVYTGRYTEAIRLMRRAMRLHPYYPAWYANVVGMAEFWRGRLDAAETALAQAHARNPDQLYTLVYRVVIPAAGGRLDAARRRAKTLREHHPRFSIDRWLADSEPYRGAEAVRMRVLLHRAGLD